MTPLPLSLLVFTSTAQHYGFKDVYRTTVDHLERKLGTLDVFANRIAHVKVRPRPEEEALLPEMLAYLASKRIEVVVTRGEWSRGMSHQNEYLRDIHRIVQDPRVQAVPYTLWLEDDAPCNPLSKNLDDLFAAACARLAAEPNTLTYRFARLGDNEALSPIDDTTNASGVFHFQPSINRSRDLLIASNLIKLNWDRFAQMQCELALTIGMGSLVPEPRFLVAAPTHAYSYHIGAPNYPELIKTLE